MTKGESRAIFLRYIGEVCSREQVPSAHANGSWGDRHDHLLDASLRAVAAAVGLPSVWRVGPGEGVAEGAYRACALPGDFLALLGVARLHGQGGTPCADYVLLPDELRLCGQAEDRFEISYLRLAEGLPFDAPDDTSIELPERAAHLLPLHCAAMALQAEDPARAAYLMDVYLHGLGDVGRPGLPLAAVASSYRMEV